MTEENNVSTLPEDFPELECSKCGKRVRPKKVKFLKRTKALQILCPECNQYTIAPKDENWEKAIQKLLEMGVITEEDLKTKKDRDERRASKEETDDESDEFEEKDEYDLLKEILDDVSEKQITKTQKKHILEWAKMKVLEPHEVYSLLVGFGVREDVAKRVSTAYAYALEKERMKKERYLNAVDTVYRSVTPKSFTSRYETPSMTSLSKLDVQKTSESYQDYQSYQTYGQYQNPMYPQYPSYQGPRWYDYGYRYPRASDSQQELVNVIRELINKVLTREHTNMPSAQGDDRILETIRSMQEEIRELREQLRRKELEAELAKRDQKIAELEAIISSLAQQIGFTQKPEKIQELEVKKETLESLANRVDNAISEVLDFLKWQSAIARGVIPTDLMTQKTSEDELRSAIDRLKKAAKRSSRLHTTEQQ